MVNLSRAIGISAPKFDMGVVGFFSWGVLVPNGATQGFVFPIFNLVQGCSKLSELKWSRLSLLCFDSLREELPLRCFRGNDLRSVRNRIRIPKIHLSRKTPKRLSAGSSRRKRDVNEEGREYRPSTSRPVGEEESRGGVGGLVVIS